MTETASIFHFQLEVLSLRWWQSLTAPANALVDETIYSTLAYSRALLRLRWITEREYQTFFVTSAITKLVASTDDHIYVHCDSETLKRRIRKRGRAHEVLYDRPYLDMLIYCFEEVATEIAKTSVVQRVDHHADVSSRIVARYAQIVIFPARFARDRSSFGLPGTGRRKRYLDSINAVSSSLKASFLLSAPSSLLRRTFRIIHTSGHTRLLPLLLWKDSVFRRRKYRTFASMAPGK